MKAHGSPDGLVSLSAVAIAGFRIVRGYFARERWEARIRSLSDVRFVNQSRERDLRGFRGRVAGRTSNPTWLK
jgi:hypothetical protein